MKKQQIIVICGGEVWDTYDEYIEYLTNYEFTEEKFNKIISQRWKDNLQGDLGDNFQVIKPQMPSVRNAKYNEWVIWFEKFFPYLKDSVILAGHSLGANFLAKYLIENKSPIQIKQLHLVAGCFGAKGGFKLSNNLNDVQKQSKNIFIYHSKDDFVVDFEDGKKYAKALPDAQFIQFEDRNHFLQSEFPEIVKNIKKN